MNSFPKSVQLHAIPQLRDPILVATWPGMGEVAVTASQYLMNKLNAEEFAEISPYEFFEPGPVDIKDNIIEGPEFPQNKFYFWKNSNSNGNDLIIFCADTQPHSNSYQYAHMVMDVAQNLGVKRVYTFAATPSHIHHTRKPKVVGVATTHPLIAELQEYDINIMGDGVISGMNGLMLGIASMRNVEGICLLAEIPIYMTDMSSPRSSKAALETLGHLLGISIDMTEMNQWIREAEEEMEKNIFQVMTSQGEGARRLLDYLDRLKQQSDQDGATEEIPEGSTEELLKEIEQFLKKGGGQTKES